MILSNVEIEYEIKNNKVVDISFRCSDPVFGEVIYEKGSWIDYMIDNGYDVDLG